MQGGKWATQTSRDVPGPKTRQRLNWRQGDQSRGRRDENGADRRGVHGGLTHLWTREAWNQAAGCTSKRPGSLNKKSGILKTSAPLIVSVAESGSLVRCFGVPQGQEGRVEPSRPKCQ